jgi:TolB-like protein/DNA-binding winged helix-turn-helix (wHTH) protein/tetratricopeptide (TPR) repeat protein
MQTGGKPVRFKFGAFEADLETGELWKSGRRVSLQEQPFRVLVALLERPGEMVTREQLRERIWPEGTFVDFDTALNKAVGKVRDVLGDSATAPRFIETLPRRGYRFLAPVEPISAGSDAVDPPLPGISTEMLGAPVVNKVEAGTHGPEERRHMRKISLTVVAVMLLASTAAALRFRGSGTGGQARFDSVAVLPLENLSGSSDNEYLADGITDELITELAKFGSLRVISRTSVMRFKGSPPAIPEIARQLNVAVIVSGSVVRAGNRVRIRAQMIDAANDQHIWAQSYEQELADLLTLQRQMAHDIATEINATLTAREMPGSSRVRAIRLDARENYWKGQTRLHDSPSEALRYFERAIELDPGYAAAYAGLAEASFWPAWIWGTASPASAFPRGKAAALKALELDPGSSAAHAALAWAKLFYEWDWRGAEESVKQAIRLSPSNAWAHHHYARILAVNGRFTESIHEANRVLELDPLDFRSGGNMAWMLYLARRFDESVLVLERMIRMYPSIHGFHRFLAWNYIAQRRLPEAIRELHLTRQVDSPAVIADVGFARGALADRAGALQAIRDLQLLASRAYVTPYYFAMVHAGAGDNDEAFRWLEKAYEERSPFLVYLRTEPRLDSLRADSRYRALLRRVGFSAAGDE